MYQLITIHLIIEEIKSCNKTLTSWIPKILDTISNFRNIVVIPRDIPLISFFVNLSFFGILLNTFIVEKVCAINLF